jgi:hypothetical protein
VKLTVGSGRSIVDEKALRFSNKRVHETQFDVQAVLRSPRNQSVLTYC